MVSSVIDRETIITECRANFQKMKQYAFDLQTYFEVKEIEVKINENEQYFQSLIELQAEGKSCCTESFEQKAHYNRRK